MRKNKVALLLWLYHTSLTDEFMSYIRPIKHIVDVYLGVCRDNDNEYALKEFSKIGIKGLTTCANQGADILPFLHQLEITKDDYLFFIKCHTKLSMWGANRSCNWRTMLLEDLIGSEEILQNNIRILSNNRNINALACPSFIFNNHEHIHSHKIAKISDIYDWSFKKRQKKFVAGTIFMGKTQYVQPLFNSTKIKIIKEFLSLEIGKVNEKFPTHSHAMERILGYMAFLNNGKISPIHNVPNYSLYSASLYKKTKSNNKIHTLRVLNNQDCYITEIPNIYGRILDNTEKHLVIHWKHNNKNNNYTLYPKINHNTLISNTNIINEQ